MYSCVLPGSVQEQMSFLQERQPCSHGQACLFWLVLAAPLSTPPAANGSQSLVLQHPAGPTSSDICCRSMTL